MTKSIPILLLMIIGSLLLVSCGNSPQFFNSQHYASNQVPPSRAQLTEDTFWEGNSRIVWGHLQYVPLAKLKSANLSDPTRMAWIKLIIISKQNSNNTKILAQQLMSWRAENPNHPGNELIPDNSTLNSLMSDMPPSHIALLLPLQGPMGSSGQAVRNGFLSAYYNSLAKTHVQQTISFYDTSQNNIGAIYQKAVSEGATMVVGPLMKENVESLLSSSSISVPTIALNYTDKSSSSNFYEFGLSSTDEAQQVADKGWRDGRSRAIIIAPQNPWGDRMSNNLISRWNSAGGSVVETFRFNSQTDFNSAIANLLHVNPTADREQMKKENNKTVLEQQRRQDFDVIFLLAEPQEARQIVPLLKYYYATDIPIYSTSAIYSGSPNRQKDTDLNGVNFADIPWIIKGSQRPAKNTNRLYAVGRDAYIISSELPRLTKLTNFPVYASTGALTLTSNRQIYRRLPWAQMHDGLP